MKIKINTTNQTCPADVLVIFMGGRKIGEGVLRGLQKGERQYSLSPKRDGHLVCKGMSRNFFLSLNIYKWDFGHLNSGLGCICEWWMDGGRIECGGKSFVDESWFPVADNYDVSVKHS